MVSEMRRRPPAGGDPPDGIELGAGRLPPDRMPNAPARNARRARPPAMPACATYVCGRYVCVLSPAVRTYVVCGAFNSFRFYRENGWLDCAMMKPRHLFWGGLHGAVL